MIRRGRRLLTAGNGVHLRDLGVPPASTASALPSGGDSGGYRLGDRVVIEGTKGGFEIDANAPLHAPARRKRSVAPGRDRTYWYAMFLQEDKTTEFRDIEGVYPSLRIPNPSMYTWGNPVASPRGDRLAFSLDSTHLAIYDMRTGRRIASLAGVSGSTMPRFSDDGRRLAVGDHAGHVGVWDASTWRRLAGGRLGQGSIRCLAFSPDNGRVAAGSWSGDVGTLDLRTGAVRRFEGVSQSVNDVTWSSDGRRLASGGSDRKVRLWDVKTGRDLGVIGRHDAEVNAVWFTRDGRTLCSVDGGGTLKLWTASG